MQKIAIFQLDNYLMSPFGKMFDLISEELFQRKYIVHLLITNDSGFDRIGSNAKGFFLKKINFYQNLSQIIIVFCLN
jgi:hypothetical protein